MYHLEFQLVRFLNCLASPLLSEIINTVEAADKEARQKVFTQFNAGDMYDLNGFKAEYDEHLPSCREDRA